MIKSFREFIVSDDVKEGSPNVELAKSLVRIAKLRWQNLAKDITDTNSFTVVENAYEAARELADALMALKGFKSYSQEASISFLAEFYLDSIPAYILNRLDRYRQIRNDIKYRGLITTADQGRQAVQEIKEAFELLLKLLQSRM